MATDPLESRHRNGMRRIMGFVDFTIPNRDSWSRIWKLG